MEPVTDNVALIKSIKIKIPTKVEWEMDINDNERIAFVKPVQKRLD
jgi:hypothetical protein